MRLRKPLVVLTLATLLAACNDEHAQKSAALVPAVPPMAAVPAATQVAPAPPAAPVAAAAPAVKVVARVAKLQGEVSAQGEAAAALSVGSLLSAGAQLSTGKDASLSLDLVNGARVTLEASTTVLLAPQLDASVLLRSGALRASLPGQGDPARAPLRLVTLDASLQAARGVDVWLSCDGFATSYVAVLSGSLQIERDQPTFSRRELGAGHAWSAARDHVATLPAKALEAARTRPRAPAQPTQPAAVEARDVQLLAAFVTLQRELAQAATAQRDTRERQRAAHAKGDAPQVQALQTELVTRAQRVVELRAQLVAAYESRLVLAVSSAQTSDATQRVTELSTQYMQTSGLQP